MRPTRAERKMLAEVVAGARKAGFRVPRITLRVVPHLLASKGFAQGATVTVERKSLDYALLCHEVAHVIVDGMLAKGAADHNRFWALVDGVLYQQSVQT